MYISANNVELYYEKIGKGEPIILLHGNQESSKIFDVLIKRLSQTHTVYAIDSRGHGKSSKVKELFYEDMAEDIACFIRELRLEKPVLYGFSDGGILGLIIASRYPDLLSRLIISGANTNPTGGKRIFTIVAKIIYTVTRSPYYKLMIYQPDISTESLNKIIIPTLVLAGSRDMIKEEHTRYIADSIKGSTLRILKGESHMSYVIHSEKLYDIIEPFLLS